MSEFPKAILLGRVEPSLIEAYLESAGYRIVGGSQDSAGRKFVLENSSGCHLGIIQIYDASMRIHADAQICPGEHTSVHGTVDLRYIMRELATEFGGFCRSGEYGTGFDLLVGRRVPDASPAHAPKF